MRDPKIFNRLQAAIKETALTSAQIAATLGASKKSVENWRSFSPACPDIPEKHLIKLEQMAASMKATRKAQPA